MATLLIATFNPGKVKEIHHEFELAARAHHDSWLGGLRIVGLREVPPPPFLRAWPQCPEDQPTFEGNAAKKARHYASLTGLLTLADDSGLCVEALGGAPGVHSARYAGVEGDRHAADAANNAKLLAVMDSVPDERRHARFVCAMALASPAADGSDLALIVDEVQGMLLREGRGDNGFGYDPLFYFPQLARTTAELDMATKSQISHRGKALRRMIEWLHTHHPG